MYLRGQSIKSQRLSILRHELTIERQAEGKDSPRGIKMQRRNWLPSITVLMFVLVMAAIPRGHTPIASRWNFNEHLYPVFQERCGSCHVDGGVAPMSLVDYRSAFPWTQSIREEILGLRMPPWQAEDGFGDFRNGHALTSTEMNMILEWSAGGYPEGPRDQTPDATAPVQEWTFGDPTVVLQIPQPFALDAATSEVIRYFVLATDIGESKSILGAELRPGARAVVRGAAIFVDTTGAARSLADADEAPGFSEPQDQSFPLTPPVAVWTPGQPSVINEAAGYHLPESADIVVRIHYKKTWITEGMDFSDQSQIGLYLSESNIRPIESLVVASPSSLSGRKTRFTHEISDDITVLALFPEVDIESSELQVEAVTPTGDRVPMLWLREPDEGWPTRFWLNSPVSLPAGSRIEVTAALEPAAERIPKPTLIGNRTAPIRFAIDYVTGSLPSN